MRIAIISFVVFVILLIGFQRWKKKYGHSCSRSKAGVKGCEKADLASQVIDLPKGEENSGIRSTEQEPPKTSADHYKSTPKGKGRTYKGSKRNP